MALDLRVLCREYHVGFPGAVPGHNPNTANLKQLPVGSGEIGVDLGFTCIIDI
jgi:hypothetical protein